MTGNSSVRITTSDDQTPDMHRGRKWNARFRWHAGIWIEAPAAPIAPGRPTTALVPDGDPRQGWERQPADGRTCGRVQRGGDQRKPPQRPDRWTGQGSYSGQPVKAAKCALTPGPSPKERGECQPLTMHLYRPPIFIGATGSTCQHWLWQHRNEKCRMSNGERITLHLDL